MKRKKLPWIIAGIAFSTILVLVLLLLPHTTAKQNAFLKRTNLLKNEVITDETINTLGVSTVDSLGHVVFFSVCDGITRAKVYMGIGKTILEAWDHAAKCAMKELDDSTPDPLWIRVDLVSNSWNTTKSAVLNKLQDTSSGFALIGLAFDSEFKTALLEEELNGRGIYDYKSDDISIIRLNEYIEEKGQSPMETLPEQITCFQCFGWLCDENNNVFPLIRSDVDCGRREVSVLDADYAKTIIDNASSYLMKQLKPDGKFIYGIYPQYDEEIDNYNILRHSGTIWSLICRYRMFPDDALKEMIERAIDYMISQIIYNDDGAAYVHEKKDYEFKLGGNGIAIVTLTEYMDVFQNDKYRKISMDLGEGILKQQNPDNGSYWHILNDDFSKGDDFRTIYYDGECTFALVRLYSLTGEQKWLDAACKAIDHFIDKDYTQYRDHWVAYSLNEVTKYVDRKEYWDFALANATNNYERIMGRARTYPTNLELLISSFETWQRMMDKGIDTGNFNVQDLLDVISARANRQLSGYFYPELAMYMANPQRILGSFMMRDDKFRVRIDDVQHNIGGFYLYWKNYDAMVAAGLNSDITADVQGTGL